MGSIGDEVKRIYSGELEKEPKKKTSKRWNWKWIFGIFLLGFIVWHIIMAIGIIYYNQFVTLEQAILAQKGQIEKEYQRRVNLVPNLIGIARDYARHERKMFQYVSDARSLLESANALEAYISDSTISSRDRNKVMKDLEKALSHLIALSEQYPDLKATQSFQDLMNVLEDTENRLAGAREQYINYVQDFNTQIVTFPSSFFNWIYRFDPKPYYEADSRLLPAIDSSKFSLSNN